MAQIAILGAGSWGSAVAISLAHQGHEVWLWARDAAQVQTMQSQRENQTYLPGIVFPKSLAVTSDLNFCLQSDNILIGVPSHAFAELLNQFPHPPKNLAWLTKGVEAKTHQLLSEIVAQKFGQIPMAMISGPSFAKEVAQSKPTALVVAANQAPFAKHWQQLLHAGPTRVYTSEDIIGVQVCGAVKNVLAIACGISDGLEYGANSRAALITRGLAEMQALGQALGGKTESFYGLAGLGDLVLTCTDNQSRNRRFGLLIGQGKDKVAACASIQQVVEGLDNVAQVHALATKHQLELPITAAVYQILYQGKPAQQAAEMLLSRPMH
jgi:glycerol-3-phosphate dehydrogenase (NAD(P)+)